MNVSHQQMHASNRESSLASTSTRSQRNEDNLGNQHVLSFLDVTFSTGHGGKTYLTSSFYAPIRKEKGAKSHIILSKISGEVRSGQLMAIMGPSGAGKTSLLKTLALQNFDGVCDGSVQLDGQDMTLAMFKRKCAFVEHHDTLWSVFTVREHLQHAANFIFPNEVKLYQRNREINQLMNILELDSCADSQASKLSSGERRRLSLAIAMMKAPQVLFLDEPTSGLDASSAAAVVKSLKQLAEIRNVIILCSIHQPSSKIFANFSHVTLLAKGRAVYSGMNGEHVLSHFVKVGYHLPMNTNPAEFLLESISTNPDALINAWQLRENSYEVSFDMPACREIANSGSSCRNVVAETAMLARRIFQLSVRDPHVYNTRVLFFFFITIFISAVYSNARERSLDFAVERALQIGWFFAVPSLLMIVQVQQSHMEHAIMLREVRLDFYNPVSYILARMVVEVQFMMLLSFSALGVGGFLVGKLQVSAFWGMVVVFATMLYAFETIAQMCSTVFRDNKSNMLVYVVLWFAGFLFSDVWFDETDTSVMFRPFFHLSPFRLSLRAFLFLDFHHSSFICGEGLSMTKAIGGGECVGKYNGDDILDTIGTFIFPVCKSDVNIAVCIGSTILIALTMKIIYAASLIHMSRSQTKLGFVEKKGKIKTMITILTVLVSLTVAFVVLNYLPDASTRDKDGSQECVSELHDLGFQLDDFENYWNYFDKNSTMTLSQAGTYIAPEGILEYVLFMFPTSHYISSTQVLRRDLHFKGYDRDKGICTFNQFGLMNYAFDPLRTGSAKSFDLTLMLSFDFNRKKEIIENVNVYYDEPTLSFFFGELARSEYVREYVCSVMTDSCSMPEENCEEKLAALPVADGSNLHVDGNSQGCRLLHAVFAEKNSKHCAHIAFEPTPDVDGNIKCQESKGVMPLDLFGEDDFAGYRAFQDNVGIAPGVGFAESVCDLQMRHIQNPTAKSANILEQLYIADLIEYTSDPKGFLLSRSEFCGSKNFASLGSVIIGDYNEVAKLISSRQERGMYLGRFRVREDRVTPFYLLSMSDAHDGAESEAHRAIHDNVAELLLRGQNNAVQNDEIRSTLENKIDIFVQNLTSSGGTDEDKELSQRFICKYMMKLILNIDVDEENVERLQRLFLNPGSYIEYIVDHAASTSITEDEAKKTRNDFNIISSIIQSSPYLEDYEPFAGAHFTKKKWADELVLLLGVGAIGGSFELLWNLLTEIPEEALRKIDISSHQDLGNVVLEAVRINAPVKEFNMILSEDTVLNVGGSEQIFPKGTIVAASLGLASLDSNVFQDPLKFDHTRPNLREKIVNFNSLGMNAEVKSARVCPGKNVAYKLGIDVLRVLLRRRQEEISSQWD